MSKDKKVSSILTGVAGEYFAAAELSRRGYVASITLRNTKGIDIIATNEEGSKTINIQVKTSGSKTKHWILNIKAESIVDKNMFYIFVKLTATDKRPNFHIIPSADVANYVKEDYKNWLKTPGKNGQKHNDTNMRKFEDPDNKYLDRWELLGLDE